jgi:hypothetical protein
MKPIAACLIAVAAALPTLSVAAPAPWYQWRSKATGELACAQTSLGSGWERYAGPYRDGRCERLTISK